MRKVLLSGAALLMLGVTLAAAADLGRMPVKAPVFSPVPVHNWTGLYIGGHVGVAGGTFDNNVALLIPGPVGEDGGLMGGVQVGYNWQVNQLVFGIEADTSAIAVGVGFTNVEVATSAGSTSKVQAGLAIGAGVEMALWWPGWSARAEYLYVEVPKDSYFIGLTRMDGGSDNHIGRFAVNYKLW
jgi:outer membrane immunogenic protein